MGKEKEYKVTVVRLGKIDLHDFMVRELAARIQKYEMSTLNKA